MSPLAQPLLPNLNAAPTQRLPVVLADRIEIMRWGLIPSWWNKPLSEMKFSTFNARAEGLLSSRVYQRPLRSQRAIVPVSWFYEWKKLEKGKLPYEIKRQDQAMIGLAGLYDMWRSPDGQELGTYTVITIAPNEVMRSLHDRMPAILTAEDEALWHNPDETEPERILIVLRPFPDELLVASPTSRDLRIKRAS